MRYKNTNKNKAKKGKRSNIKLKNKNSDTNMIDPGKPRNIKVFNNVIKKSFGHMKLIPLTSVNKRVLNRRAIASTKRKELVESNV